MNDQVVINCTGTHKASLDDFEHFQGDLKILEDENYEKLKSQIIRHGFCESLTVWIQDNKLFLLNGNQRILTLKKMKEEGYQIPDIPFNVTKAENEKKAKEILLSLTSNYGKMTEDGLRSFCEEADLVLEDMVSDFRFPELDFGFDLSDDDDVESTEGDDDIPEKVETICKRGDLWQLGEHRLMCGDSTDNEIVEILMDGNQADFGFCDPPYNIGYKYNSYDDNLTNEEYINFSKKWFKILDLHTVRQSLTLGTKNINVMVSLKDYAGVACWVKKNWISSCKIANLQQWEPIFFYGDYKKLKRPSDLFEINRVVQKDVGDNHSCPKQMELIVDIFKNYSEKSVLDLFMGSGTSIIACEKLKRKCYGMEIDPYYCDVIIQRYIHFCNTNNIDFVIKRNGEIWN